MIKRKSKWMKGFIITTEKKDDLEISQINARLAMALAGKKSRHTITVK